MRDACDKRSEAANSTFCYEFTNVHERLVNKDLGKPCQNRKSDLLKIVAPESSSVANIDNGNVLVVDCSVVIRSEAEVISPHNSHL